MTNCKCGKPATVLQYCSSCWEKHEPTHEELEEVISQQMAQLPRWWRREEDKLNEQQDC
jgi:hypothetical protein